MIGQAKCAVKNSLNGKKIPSLTTRLSLWFTQILLPTWGSLLMVQINCFINPSPRCLKYSKEAPMYHNWRQKTILQYKTNFNLFSKIYLCVSIKRQKQGLLPKDSHQWTYLHSRGIKISRAHSIQYLVLNYINITGITKEFSVLSSTNKTTQKYNHHSLSC